MSRFLGPLEVTLISDQEGTWGLLKSLSYESEVYAGTITAPAGFVTDFASGPGIGLISVARDSGRPAAVIHDWLYSTQCCSRSMADEVLREAMLVCGYSKLVADAYYAAVRAFGWMHWSRKNQPQNDAVSAIMARTKGRQSSALR